MKAMFFILTVSSFIIYNFIKPVAKAKTTSTTLGTSTKADVVQKFTFKLAEVERAKTPLEESILKDVLYNRFVQEPQEAMRYANIEKPNYEPPKRWLECFSRDRRNIIQTHQNGLFSVANQAYAEHRPLVLSPDMIWLAITQGFALHVNQNPEKLRPHFVNFEGKKVLHVKLDDFHLGNDKNDWEWSFGEFQKQIKANTGGEIADLVAGRFSTTDMDAQVAFDITLMDATKSYFDFWGEILCGIPEITIEGTPEDWQQIEKRTAQLAKYDLDWWVNDLKPLLAEFTKTAQGKPDKDFWTGMMKYLTQAAGCRSDTYYTGWIIRLFPYIKIDNKYVQNPLVGKNIADFYKYLPKHKAGNNDFVSPTMTTDDLKGVVYSGPKIELKNIPDGISNAILNVDDNGNLHKMELKAGFLGMRQDAVTLALRPVIGWAIVETGEIPDKDAIKRYEEFKINQRKN